MVTIKTIPLSKDLTTKLSSIIHGGSKSPEKCGPIKCIIGGKICEILEFNNMGIYAISAGSKECDISVAYQYMNEVQLLIATSSKDLLTWQMKFDEDTFFVDFEQYVEVLPLLGRTAVIESKEKPWNSLPSMVKIKIPEVSLINGPFSWILEFDDIEVHIQGKHNADTIANKMGELGYKIN